MTASVHVLDGRYGGLVKWSRVSDRPAATADARAQFLSRFDREVDPEGILDPAVRAIRADTARRAYFAKLSRIRWYGEPKQGSR